MTIPGPAAGPAPASKTFEIGGRPCYLEEMKEGRKPAAPICALIVLTGLALAWLNPAPAAAAEAEMGRGIETGIGMTTPAAAPAPPNPLLYLDIWLFGGLILLVMLALTARYLWNKFHAGPRDPEEGLQPWEDPDNYDPYDDYEDYR